MNYISKYNQSIYNTSIYNSLSVNKKSKLDTPVCTFVQEDNIIHISWIPIKNASYYKMMVNGLWVESTSELSISWQTDIDGIFTVGIKAIPSDIKNYSSSILSNTETFTIMLNEQYLMLNDKYLTILCSDGVERYLKLIPKGE